MDLNLVILCGRLVGPPEHRTYPSGARLLRLLLTVRSDSPRRRIDVVPVTKWDPDDDTLAAVEDEGVRLWVTGAIQRRFADGPLGRTSRLEVVAFQITRRETIDEWAGRAG